MRKERPEGHSGKSSTRPGNILKLKMNWKESCVLNAEMKNVKEGGRRMVDNAKKNLGAGRVILVSLSLATWWLREQRIRVVGCGV